MVGAAARQPAHSGRHSIWMQLKYSRVAPSGGRAARRRTNRADRRVSLPADGSMEKDSADVTSRALDSVRCHSGVLASIRRESRLGPIPIQTNVTSVIFKRTRHECGVARVALLVCCSGPPGRSPAPRHSGRPSLLPSSTGTLERAGRREGHNDPFHVAFRKGRKRSAVAFQPGRYFFK